MLAFLVVFPGTIWLVQLNPAVPQFDFVVGGRINVELEHPVTHSGTSGADSTLGEVFDLVEVIFVMYVLCRRGRQNYFPHDEYFSSLFFCAFSNVARIKHIFTSSSEQERLKCRT